MDKELKRHVFSFDENVPGGESLTLRTSFGIDLAGEVCIEQELTLWSYFNCASFHLNGSKFTPEILRKLADELEFINPANNYCVECDLNMGKHKEGCEAPK